MTFDLIGLTLLSASGVDPCTHFEAFRRAGVPAKPLRQVLSFFREHQRVFPRHDWVSIADYGQRSNRPRFYMLNLETGVVIVEKVSHGSGHQGRVRWGDPNHDGMLDRCHYKGNRRGMTRPGFFRTAELYRSRKHTGFRRFRGRRVREWPFLDDRQRFNGLRLDGLSPGLNEHARTRGIVMHGAWYNDVQAIMGRSYGCPAFTSQKAPEVLNRIKGGTLFYAFTPQCADDQRTVDAMVEGWPSMCRPK